MIFADQLVALLLFISGIYFNLSRQTNEDVGLR